MGMRVDQVVKWCRQTVTFLLTLAFSHVYLLLLATPGKFTTSNLLLSEVIQGEGIWS
jgi:hypothetical protein